jgi:uncharacterized protein YegJ (DUF2314 family)
MNMSNKPVKQEEVTMSYGNQNYNSGGCGTSIFAILIFIVAGFLACALIWSYSTGKLAQETAAEEAEQQQSELEIANLKIAQLETALGEAERRANYYADIADQANTKAADLETTLEATNQELTIEKHKVAVLDKLYRDNKAIAEKLTNENKTLRIWVAKEIQDRNNTNDIAEADPGNHQNIIPATGGSVEKVNPDKSTQTIYPFILAAALGIFIVVGREFGLSG